MKLAIVAKSRTEDVEDLLVKAPALGLTCEQIDITDPNLETIDADIIYWRSASVTKFFKQGSGRTVVLKRLREQLPIVNNAIIDNPQLTRKSFQQAHFAAVLPKMKGIATYLARNPAALADLVAKGQLTYPIIAKPDHGSQGKGIELLSSAVDLVKLKDLSTYVFQNYIPNSGDYRIFVVGGVAIDVAHRRASATSSKNYLNNLSQGGAVERVEDPKLYYKLAQKAETIAVALGLTICAVDLIQNKDTGEIHFMEINSVPQWVMFAPALKQDIGEHILLTLRDAALGGEKFTLGKISAYYDRHLSVISPQKSFHYLSRLYLWTREERYLEQLKTLKTSWLPDPTHFTKLARQIPNLVPARKSSGKPYRRGHHFHHHKISKYNQVFFKALFLRSIFDDTLAEEIISAIDLTDVAMVREKLLADQAAIFALATEAVNFLYHYSYFFAEQVEPGLFLEIAESQTLPSVANTLEARLYMLTHAVIGASHFYAQRKIDSDLDIYIAIVQRIETDIIENFSLLSLDIKCEFLVCASLVGHRSVLETTIRNEVEASRSPHGDFIVDTLNVHKTAMFKKGLQVSEHRNVLALMAFGREKFSPPSLRNQDPQ